VRIPTRSRTPPTNALPPRSADAIIPSDESVIAPRFLENYSIFLLVLKLTGSLIRGKVQLQETSEGHSTSQHEPTTEERT
jgi:hypothetical protein